MYYSHTQARAKLPKKRRRVVNTSAISEARKNRRNRSESKKMSLTKLGIVSRHGECWEQLKMLTKLCQTISLWGT